MLYLGNISEHYKKYLLCEFLDPNFHMGQGLAETRGFVGIGELASLGPNFCPNCFEPSLCRRSFEVKIRMSKPEKLGFHLSSFNMQLLANYTAWAGIVNF